MATKLTNLQKLQREQYIKSSAIAGLGATKTYKALQDLGIGGRKTDVLAKYRSDAKIPQKQKSIAHVGNLKTISRMDYKETGEFFSQDFRYTMKYKLYNRDTGEEQEFYTTMTSPTAMKPGEIKTEAMKALVKWGQFYRFSIRQASIFEAEHDPKAAWE